MQQYIEKIKEIDNLSRKKRELKKESFKQNKRTSKVIGLISDREEQLEELLKNKKLNFSQQIKNANNIDSLNTLLDKRKAQLNQILTADQQMTINDEIENSLKERESLEEEQFLLLEKIEELEEEIKDCHTFIKGAGETLIEITQEVEEEFSELNMNIENIDSRLEDLYNNLPSNLSERIKTLISKELRSTILSRIEKGACHYCGYQAPVVEIQKVEKEAIFCKSCSRLFAY